MFFRNTNLAGMLENRSDELLFDALPIGVYLCGPDGTIVRYNRTAAELWGRSPRSVVRRAGIAGPAGCSARMEP